MGDVSISRWGGQEGTRPKGRQAGSCLRIKSWQAAEDAENRQRVGEEGDGINEGKDKRKKERREMMRRS
jgi:hypothetical protein